MKYGMISTGSKEATLAACEILENNGNAFDAAIGAVFTSMVSEHCLTGPCGGGVMLASSKDKNPIIYDFFVDAIPLNGNRIDKKYFFPITVDFGNATQIFHTGKASIGIPGTLIGLIQAHKELGQVSLESILKPAIYYAENGAIINKSQFYVMQLLEDILRHDPNSRYLYFDNDKLLNSGEIFKNEPFAFFLNELIKYGFDDFYSGKMMKTILGYLGKGSLLTENNWNKYRVIKRNPLKFCYNQNEILTNPNPSIGGRLIELIFHYLKIYENNYSDIDIAKGINLTNIVKTHIYTEKESEPYVNTIIKELQGKASFLNEKTAIKGFGSTTHVSVMDKKNNAASITTTNGEGCGYLIPDYGIMPNNMMGEIDLNIFGFHKWKNTTRLPTMMAPTMLKKNNKIKYVLGTGGSSRIKSAITQVLLNLIDKRLSLEDSISMDRLHFENNKLYLEQNLLNNQKIDKKIKIHRFSKKNLYFGGVNAVSNTEAISDIRRDGYACEY